MRPRFLRSSSDFGKGTLLIGRWYSVLKDFGQVLVEIASQKIAATGAVNSGKNSFLEPYRNIARDNTRFLTSAQSLKYSVVSEMGVFARITSKLSTDIVWQCLCV